MSNMHAAKKSTQISSSHQSIFRMLCMCLLFVTVLLPAPPPSGDTFTATFTNIDAIFSNINDASLYPVEYKLGEIDIKIGSGYTVKAISGNGSKLQDIDEVSYDLKVVDNNTGSGTSTGFQTLDPITAAAMYSSTSSIKKLSKLDVFLSFTTDPAAAAAGTYTDTITLTVESTALTSDMNVNAPATGLLTLSAESGSADAIFSNISEAELSVQYKIGTLTVSSTSSAYTISAESLNAGVLYFNRKNEIDYSVQIATNGTAVSEGLKALTTPQLLITSTASTGGLPLVLDAFIEFTGATLAPVNAANGTYTDTIIFTISSI